MASEAQPPDFKDKGTCTLKGCGKVSGWEFLCPSTQAGVSYFGSSRPASAPALQEEAEVRAIKRAASPASAAMSTAVRAIARAPS